MEVHILMQEQEICDINRPPGCISFHWDTWLPLSLPTAGELKLEVSRSYHEKLAAGDTVRIYEKPDFF